MKFIFAIQMISVCLIGIFLLSYDQETNSPTNIIKSIPVITSNGRFKFPLKNKNCRSFIIKFSYDTQKMNTTTVFTGENVFPISTPNHRSLIVFLITQFIDTGIIENSILFLVSNEKNVFFDPNESSIEDLFLGISDRDNVHFLV